MYWPITSLAQSLANPTACYLLHSPVIFRCQCTFLVTHSPVNPFPCRISHVSVKLAVNPFFYSRSLCKPAPFQARDLFSCIFIPCQPLPCQPNTQFISFACSSANLLLRQSVSLAAYLSGLLTCQLSFLSKSFPVVPFPCQRIPLSTEYLFPSSPSTLSITPLSTHSHVNSVLILQQPYPLDNHSAVNPFACQFNTYPLSLCHRRQLAAGYPSVNLLPRQP